MGRGRRRVNRAIDFRVSPVRRTVNAQALLNASVAGVPGVTAADAQRELRIGGATRRAMGLLNVAVGNEPGNATSLGALDALRVGAGLPGIPGQRGFSHFSQRQAGTAKLPSNPLTNIQGLGVSHIDEFLDTPNVSVPRVPRPAPGSAGRRDFRGVDPQTRRNFNAEGISRRRFGSGRNRRAV